jgi:hypothetical protein
MVSYTEERIMYEQQLAELQRKIEYTQKCEGVFTSLLAKLNTPSVQELMSLTASVADNLIISAKTQVGKTRSIINCMKNTTNSAIKVFVCDNKTDQLRQMKTRCVQENINCNFVTELSKRTTRSQLIQSENVNLLMLNNDKQIEKLIVFFKSIFATKQPNQIIFFFDEGDTVAKTDDVYRAVAKDPSSHKKWIELHDMIKTKNVAVFKRVFISATPENCQYLYNIKTDNVFFLPTPADYRGINEHQEWENSLSSLISEVDRITREKSREAILYCVDVINANQSAKAELLSRFVKCPIIVYNSESIVIREFVEDKWKQYNSKNSISDVLASFQKKTDGPVIILGYRLMDRGLSYVSSIPKDVDPKPLTATVMFFYGGITAHTVGLTQRFGRITGTSRPDISRRAVYCPEAFYNSYVSYIENQEKVQSMFETAEPGTMISELMEEANLVKLNRKLDRPTLKRVNNHYESCSSDSDTDSAYESETDLIDGVKIRNLYNWSTGTTLVARMIRFLYTKNVAVNVEEFKQSIYYQGSDADFQSNIDNARNKRCKYGKLWSCKENIVEINPNIKTKLDEIYNGR